MSFKQSQKQKSNRLLALSYLCAVLLIALDQITKFFASLRLKGQNPFVLIPGVFELRYLENQSAAFSLDLISILHKIFHFSYFNAYPDAFLRTKMVFFAVVTLIVVVFLIAVYRKIPWNRHFLPINLIILFFLSGAIGNLIDRIFHHYVIDFFYFCLIDFPIFNVADIYVTVAAFAFVLTMLFVYKDNDFEPLFHSERGRK